jgi:hypothetical protein
MIGYVDKVVFNPVISSNVIQLSRGYLDKAFTYFDPFTDEGNPYN